MESPVHIAIIPLVETSDRIDHRTRFVGRRRVVEIHQRMTADVLVENWEI